MSDCTRHPGVKAAWSCAQCATLLCEDCGADDYRTKRRIARCATCGGFAEEVRVYVEILPARKMLAPFVRSLVTLEGTAFWGVLVAVLILSSLPGVGGVLSLAMLISWYLVVVSAASEGVSVPPPASLENAGGLGGAVWRLVVGCFWPLVLVALPSLAHRTSLVPLYCGVAFAAALALMPAVLARTTLTTGLLQLLDPRAPIVFIARAPMAYARALALWLVMLLGGLVPGQWLSALADRGGGFGVSLLAQVVSLLGWTLSAFSVGWWVYEHAELFGLRDPAERWVLQVRDPVGRARLPRLDPEAGAAPVDGDGLPLGRAEPLERVDPSQAAAPLPVDDSVTAFAPGGGYALAAEEEDDAPLPVDSTVTAFAQGAQAALPARPPSAVDALPVDHGNLEAARLLARGGPGSPPGELAQRVAAGDAAGVAAAWAELKRVGTEKQVDARVRLEAAELVATQRAGRAAEILKSVVTDADPALAAAAAEQLVALLLRERRPKEALAVVDALGRVGRATPALLERRAELAQAAAALADGPG